MTVGVSELDDEMEGRLVEAMADADLETLRIMSDSGATALSGMHGHIDALHSKNAVLMGLSLGVISLILVFTLEFDWLARPEMAWPITLFSILMIVSISSSLVLFWPRDYGDSDFYGDEHVCDNLAKTPRTILEDHIITFKDALDECNRQYSRDTKVFWIGLIVFILALVALFLDLVQ